MPLENRCKKTLSEDSFRQEKAQTAGLRNNGSLKRSQETSVGMLLKQDTVGTSQVTLLIPKHNFKAKV